MESSARIEFLGLDLEQWVNATARLLHLEQDAEVEAACAALSNKNDGASLRLQVDGVTTGLLARTVVTLMQRNGLVLPNHAITTGDIVGLSRIASGGSTRAGPGIAGGASTARDAYEATAVVVAVSKTSISAALDDRGSGGGHSASAAVASNDPITEGEVLRVDKLADDVSFRRISSILHDLRDYRHGAAGKVLRLLFSPVPSSSDTSAKGAVGGESPSFARGPLLRDAARSGDTMGTVADSPGVPFWVPLNPGLNTSQLRAVESALRASDLCMIHGPPGTGKTTAVVEYIAQEVLRGNRVREWSCWELVAPPNYRIPNLGLVGSFLFDERDRSLSIVCVTGSRVCPEQCRSR
jgi:ATP-dependent RNA/DNA helicase IGHMBP2